MFGSLSFFRQTSEMELRAIKAQTERRMAIAVPWSPDIKWEPQLNIQASTYKIRHLFPDCPVIQSGDPNKVPNPGIISPNGQWLYAVKEISAGGKLATWYGSKIGNVLFDGPALIPCVHERDRFQPNPEKILWDRDPWMSLTPAELISMRGGTKRAKGKVIVAGLGLGHQLIEVSQRKQVTELTLVEKSQELVDWILPQIKPFLGREVNVVVGDAMHLLPNMTADVALVDIFPSYGNNDYEQSKLRSMCFSIGYIWCWGAAQIE